MGIRGREGKGRDGTRRDGTGMERKGSEGKGRDGKGETQALISVKGRIEVQWPNGQRSMRRLGHCMGQGRGQS